MKTLITLLLISLTCYAGYSQKKSPRKGDSEKLKKITFDLPDDVLKYESFEINQDGSIEVEINNVNLFLYSITLSEIQNDVINDSKLNESNTSLVLNPIMYDITDVSLRNINIFPISTENTDQSKKVAFERLNNEIADLLKRGKDISRQEDKIDELTKSYLSLSNDTTKFFEKNSITESLYRLGFKTVLKPDSAIKQDSINQKLKSELESKKKSLLELREQIKDSIKVKEVAMNSIDVSNSLENKKINELRQNFRNYTEVVTALKNTVYFYRALLCVLYSEKTFTEIENDKIALAGYYFHRTEQMEILHEMNNSLIKLDKEYSNILTTYAELNKPTKEENRDNIATLRTFHNQIKVASFENLFLQIAKVYGAINKKNFTLKYRTLIINPDADEVRFNLNFIPQQNLPCVLSHKPYSLVYKVKIKNGLKLDVSSGLFANLGGVRSKSYYFATENNNSRIVKEELRDVATPSIGVLLNIHKRNCPLGVSTGISTSDAQRLKYYLGGSLLLGNSQRMVFSTGVVMGQVDVPTSEFAVNKVIDAGIGSLPSTVPLRSPSPYRLGWFLGITYNLTGKNKSEYLSKLAR